MIKIDHIVIKLTALFIFVVLSSNYLLNLKFDGKVSLLARFTLIVVIGILFGLLFEYLSHRLNR